MKVLIVDDATVVRKMIGTVIRDLGHEVVGEACTGLEGIYKVRELEPDIMFLDITMPEMDGLTAIPKILESNPKTKIIVCSALGQKEMVVEAIQKGAKNFIVKPFQRETIDRTINAVMGELDD